MRSLLKMLTHPSRTSANVLSLVFHLPSPTNPPLSPRHYGLTSAAAQRQQQQHQSKKLVQHVVFVTTWAVNFSRTSLQKETWNQDAVWIVFFDVANSRLHPVWEENRVPFIFWVVLCLRAGFEIARVVEQATPLEDSCLQRRQRQPRPSW